MVSPGPTETAIFTRETPEDQVRALRDMTTGNVPMKRMGEPDEIARAILLLASGEAATSTGSICLSTAAVSSFDEAAALHDAR